MIKKFKDLKLQTQMIALIAFFSVFTILLSTVLFFGLHKLLSNKITNSVKQVFNVAEMEIVSFNERIDQINLTINSMPEFRKIISMENLDNLNMQFYYLYQNSLGELNSFFISSKYLKNIMLSVNGNHLFFNNTEIAFDHIQSLQLEEQPDNYVKLLPTAYQIKGKHEQDLVISRKTNMFGLNLQNKYAVTLIYIISSDFFSDICSKYSITKNSRIYIISGLNEIVGRNSGTLNAAIETEIVKSRYANANEMEVDLENVRYMLHTHNIGKSDWRLVSVTPSYEYAQELGNISVAYFSALFAFIVIQLVFCFFILSNITNPIKSIAKTIDSIRKGNMKSKCGVVNNNEIGEIANHFNLMMDDINSLTRNIFENQTKLYEAEIANKNAKLIALQSQINPHLLYNTLASIQSIAIYRNIDDISEICNALATIYRFSIKGGDYVAVRAELENLRNYIFIQNLSIGNEIKFRLEFSPEIMEYDVMKLLLQPFVENAINHGHIRKIGYKYILVKGYMDNDHLCFEILDNGTGIDGDLLEKLNRKVEIRDFISDRQHEKKSIGILNVKQRLNIYYGDKHYFHMDSSQSTGTRVFVRIPGIRGEIQ